MADSTQDTSSLDCIPEIYLERRSAQSTHHSHHGRVQPRGEGVGETGKQPTAGESNDDLVKEGFIPYNELKLHHLPEAIRTQENLDRILSIGERVVCVNNNQLSEKRNLEKEMKMAGMTLKGTGFVTGTYCMFGNRLLTIFTNRHVLYNHEEIRKSTIDFNFDSYLGSQQVRKMERTKRGNGLFDERQNSKVDFSTAIYLLHSNSKTAFEDKKLLNENLRYWSGQSVGTSEKSLGKGIVCVISHPLGRWKHVSFGKIVTCRPKDNIFLYDAPTKPGSSGAPIIVFGGSVLNVPPASLFYHEGVDHKTNLKKGHVEVNFGFVDVRWVPDVVEKDPNDKTLEAKSIELVDDNSTEELRQPAQIDIQSLRLGAFFPIFAAFLLQPEKYCSRVLTLPSAPPCQSLSKRDVDLSAVDKKCMSEQICDIAHHNTSLYPPHTSEAAESGVDLSPLLTTEAPCWCQAIVEAVVHTSRSDKDTGVFLRPDAVCGDFRQNPSWPWSLDRCGGSSGPGREPMLKHCLLKECLDVFRGTTMEREVPLQLLVLIRRANDIMRQSPAQTPQAQHGCPDFTSTTTVTSAHTKSDDQRPEVAQNSVSSSVFKQLGVVFDVFCSLQQVVMHMASWSLWIQYISQSTIEETFKPSNPGDECTKNFYKVLELICHLKHHYSYDHPDSPPSQGVPQPRPRCECGRPSLTDVTKALLDVCTTRLLQFRLAAKGEKTEGLLEPPLKKKISSATPFGMLISRLLLECQSTDGVPYILEQFLSRVDSLDNFRNSCDVISVAVTSSEVFLFNSRNLLRQYRHHLFPFYISGPVSVFGRPGRWAGGHTPEEIKKTAWRLIRVAFGESRHGRECLEVLERDTPRREKLIDLYVDMKQLKFSGDIEEEKMTVKYMMHMKVKRMFRETKVTVKSSINDNPTAFMMRTFLKLVPWPSWDRTWQKTGRWTQP